MEGGRSLAATLINGAVPSYTFEYWVKKRTYLPLDLPKERARALARHGGRTRCLGVSLLFLIEHTPPATRRPNAQARKETRAHRGTQGPANSFHATSHLCPIPERVGCPAASTSAGLRHRRAHIAPSRCVCGHHLRKDILVRGDLRKRAA